MKNIREIIVNVDSFTDWNDANELVKAWSHNAIVWSWGAHAWKLYNRKFLRFSVNGHLHKGHVWIMVNGHDLFDVYFTSTQGNIKQEVHEVYLDELTNSIDIIVERQPNYQW